MNHNTYTADRFREDVEKCKKSLRIHLFDIKKIFLIEIAIHGMRANFGHNALYEAAKEFEKEYFKYIKEKLLSELKTHPVYLRENVINYHKYFVKIFYPDRLDIFEAIIGNNAQKPKEPQTPANKQNGSLL